MANASELLAFPTFDGLPPDQIEWFLSQSRELHLKPGDIFVQQGDPADAMFVVLEGQFQARGEVAGESFLFTSKAGDVTGILPFSRMKQFVITGRASTDGRMLRFPAAKF